MPELHLPDAATTEALGRRLAAKLRPGDVIALHGDLGAGKTTLARALIQAALGEAVDVPSPTYTLIQSYAGPDFELHHLDLYRIESPEDVFELGWSDLAAGVMLVEWPGKAGRYLPSDRLDVTLQFTPSGRAATVCATGEAWHDRLKELEHAA